MMKELSQTEMSALYSDLKQAGEHLNADVVQRAINYLSQFRKERDAYARALKKAARSLESAGFTDEGGELWKPPVNTKAADLQRERDELKHKLKCAIDYIKETPCDPDIYPEQLKAYDALQATGAMQEHEATLRNQAGEEG